MPQDATGRHRMLIVMMMGAGIGRNSDTLELREFGGYTHVYVYVYQYRTWAGAGKLVYRFMVA